MSWRWKAACRGEPTELFFAERGRAQKTAQAKAICRECPVRIDCLDFALSFADKDLPGIYGGTTENERRVMRNTRYTG